MLELLSIAGFVVVFKLVFGTRMQSRQGVRAGLRGLAASTLLPAGGLIGRAAAARSALPGNPALRVTIRSAVAFTILTSTPGALVLGGLGLLVWEGAAAGPHAAALTLLPAGLSLSVVVAALLVRGSSTEGCDASKRREVAGPGTHSGPLRGGVREARQLLASLNWHLVGAAAYYVFDNAVLWATFHAYGRTPPVSVIVMGYLVGSFAGALPVPAGLGVVDGGMMGALVLYGAPAGASAGAVVLYRAVSLSLALILGAATWHAGGSEQRRSQGGLTPGPEPRTAAGRSDPRRARRIPSAIVTIPRRIMIHSTMVHRDVEPAVAPGPDSHEESWQLHRVNARAQSPPPTDSSRGASKVRRFRGAGS
jgi:uncharacterized membrane protein YbhN (UPF0104 family)